VGIKEIAVATLRHTKLSRSHRARFFFNAKKRHKYAKAQRTTSCRLFWEITLSGSLGLLRQSKRGALLASLGAMLAYFLSATHFTLLKSVADKNYANIAPSDVCEAPLFDCLSNQKGSDFP